MIVLIALLIKLHMPITKKHISSLFRSFPVHCIRDEIAEEVEIIPTRVRLIRVDLLGTGEDGEGAGTGGWKSNVMTCINNSYV
jgi:hypothetical protein